MPSEQYELTGSALYGAEPHLMSRGLMAAALEGKSEAVKVCMGARLDEVALPARVPRLADFFDPTRARLALPAATNYRAKAARSLATMLGNDSEGDCTCASVGHQTGVWSANDSDSPGEVVMTTQEALSIYHAIGGPGDNGLAIRDVLDWWMTRGITIGGKLHKIDGYAAVDPTNAELVKGAILAFGGLKIGFYCPQAFLQNKDWSYVGPPVTSGRRAWGGHDAPPVDFTPAGPMSASWGRVYQWDWKAFGSYVSECYVVLCRDWYNADGVAPSGFDVSGLKAAMESLRNGTLPPDPAPVVPPSPPSPPTPPGPPVPPAGNSYQISGLFTGSVAPVPQPDAVTIDCPHEVHGLRLVNLFGRGCGLRWEAGKLHASRPAGVTPQQWANLIQLLLALARIFAELAPLFA